MHMSFPTTMTAVASRLPGTYSAGSFLWARTLPPCAPAFPAVGLFLEEPSSFVWIIGGTRLRQCTGEHHRTQAPGGSA